MRTGYMVFWVIGGIYKDITCREFAPGERLRRVGPFATRDLAQDVCRTIQQQRPPIGVLRFEIVCDYV